MRVIKPSDLKIECYKSSGPGGQRKNKRETAVRITHTPTGITVVSTSERSQIKNRRKALGALQERLKKFFKKKKKRIPTKKPAPVKEMTLQNKKARGKVKRLRKKVNQLDYE